MQIGSDWKSLSGEDKIAKVKALGEALKESGLSGIKLQMIE